MAEKKKKAGTQLRPLEAQVLQFEVLGEMTGLLQRVRANKSQRSASVLVKTGPIRVQVLGLGEDGEPASYNSDGPFTIQCLLGRVSISIQGHDQRLTTGDLLVVDAGAPHDITAEEASVLLVTTSSAEAQAQ
jgi:mannose-6-phosphate isomerase-like protein (cupin superfamily)